jgi:hypothetical protein
MRALSIVLVSAAGCVVDDQAVTSLADMGVTDLTIVLGMDDVFRVTFGQDTERDTCPVLRADFSGSVAGVDLPIVDRGSFTGRFDGYADCARPKLELAHPPFTSPAVLEFGDPTLTVRCDLGGSLAQRVATPIDGSWELTANQPATVEWSNPGELVDGAAVDFIGGPRVGATILMLGDLLTFRTPSGLSGAYDIEIRRSGAFYRVIDCGGIDNRLLESSTRPTFRTAVTVR